MVETPRVVVPHKFLPSGAFVQVADHPDHLSKLEQVSWLHFRRRTALALRACGPYL